MSADKKEQPKVIEPPTALDVYFGLIELLRRSGVRNPGGSVSCRRMTGLHPRYVVASESYMAAQVQLALSKLLQRQVSFAAKGGVTLSTEDAHQVASCAIMFQVLQ
jgi:hypothetical protein